MRVTAADRAVYSVEDRVQRWLEQTGPVRVFGSDLLPEPEVRFSDIADVRRYVEQVLAHLRVVVAAGDAGDVGSDAVLVARLAAPVRVRARRGAAGAHYEAHSSEHGAVEEGVIAVPPRDTGGAWALRETVVLHELAHHLAPDAGHSPAFVRRLLWLYDRTGHPVLARMAQAAFDQAGIRA